MKKKDDNLNYLVITIIILLSFFIFINVKSVNGQCSPNIVNSSWGEWKDTSECNNNQIDQRRELVQHDANDCGVFEDKVISEERTARCEYVKTGLIEELQNNLLLFGILILLMLILIIVLVIIFIFLAKSDKKNESKNVTTVKVLERVKKEEKVSFSNVPRESFFSRMIKNWHLNAVKRRRLKEQSRFRREQELERAKRLEWQRKERQKALGLELSRKREQENRRLELERNKLRKDSSIFSGFGNSINLYFAKRRKLKEQRKLNRLREIEQAKKRGEEERKEIERKKTLEIKRKETEILNLILERKEREKALELDLIREKKRKEEEKKRLEFERAKARNKRINRFKGIFSGFGQGIGNYFEKRRMLREEERRKNEERREENKKRWEEEKRLNEVKEKENNKTFEEKYYPPERLALLNKARKEQENLNEQKINSRNKDELFSDEFNPSSSITNKISNIQRERKNYLLERKIKEQQNKVITEIIETKKNEIGKWKKKEINENSKKNIIKPKIVTEAYTPVTSIPKSNIKIKQNKETDLIKSEIKDKESYDENKPNLNINLGMNRTINKNDNRKNEFYNNINSLISLGENAVISNNLEEAQEIYDKIKTTYKSEYDQDKSLHRRIISYYYNILNLINKNK